MRNANSQAPPQIHCIGNCGNVQLDKLVCSLYTLQFAVSQALWGCGWLLRLENPGASANTGGAGRTQGDIAGRCPGEVPAGPGLLEGYWRARKAWRRGSDKVRWTF